MSATPRTSFCFVVARRPLLHASKFISGASTGDCEALDPTAQQHDTSSYFSIRRQPSICTKPAAHLVACL
ncbi:hypothetical protein EUGRSUZ_E02323 [Eucalyptus grandis]|uniref:Uncharacterized protein n=2 Tax=Eucalyptus grandis TaxID=71139 RepID=A0A059C5S1_EUCGR|nr:hypothetical protein EUGRSUZ_E02323 [Eucalyptus grandis]